jgi:hypothetical protein
VRFTEGWQALLTTLGPLLGVVIGYIGAALTESRRDQRALSSAREDRVAQREQAREDAADNFERNVLGDVYVRMSELARAMARAHLEDEKVARLAGTAAAYGSKPIDEEISKELLLANREVYRLRLLLLAPELREAVTAAHSAANDVSASRDLHQADALYQIAVFKIDEAQTLIADRLRRLYVPSGDRLLASG